MRNRWLWKCGSLGGAAIGALLTAAPAELLAGSADDCAVVERVKAVGAMQAWLDQRSGLREVARPDPSSVELDRVDLLSGGPIVYRVTSNIPHAHPYLIVCSQVSVVRLGGFPDPELRGMLIADILGPEAKGWQRGEVADMLVRLMDDNGAYQLLTPFDTTRLARTWRQTAKDARWSGADTIVVESDGSWFARRTILSRNMRSYTRAWNALRLTLWVGRDGKVEAWSLIRGEAIPGSGQ